MATQQEPGEFNLADAPAEVTFYRYGEVMILYQRDAKIADRSPMHADELVSIVDRLAQAGIGVAPDPTNAFFGEPAIFETETAEYTMRVLNVGPRNEGREQQEHPNNLDLDIARNREIQYAFEVVGRAIEALSGAPAIQAGRFRVLRASPNWRIAGQGDEGDSGPGGRPVAATAKYFRQGKSVNDKGEATNTGNPNRVRQEYDRIIGNKGNANPRPDRPGAGVRVAILDTWPVAWNPDTDALDPTMKIAQFTTTNGITGATNPLLFQASKNKLIDTFQDMGPLSYRAYHLNWTTRSFERPYDLSDHGLFVAGIIHDIAPGATISVYRVLNDYGGGGSISLLYLALSQAMAAAAKAGERLIVNMSLSVHAPIRMIKALLAFPVFLADRDNLIDALEATSTRSPDVDVAFLALDGLVDIDSSFRVVNWKGPLAFDHFVFDVLAANVLTVAAAGNDSDRPTRIFSPRLPAALENVLGVGAKGDGTPDGAYSNRDDLDRFRRDGVIAYGGTRRLDAVTHTNHTRFALHGLAVSPMLPPLPEKGPATVDNTTGWAAWAGTSFATPIVSGLAACIWGENPGWTRRQVLDQLVTPAAGPANDIQLTQA